MNDRPTPPTQRTSRSVTWIGALGALLGATGVLVGASTRHLLSRWMTPDMLELVETGARYQIVHAVAAVATAMWLDRRPSRSVAVAGWAFVLGIVLFSGGLDLAAFSGMPARSGTVPIGGLCFVAGWVCLAVGFLRRG